MTLRRLFSSKYSFLPRPNAYFLLEKQKQIGRSWQAFRTKVLHKIPPNLRMAHLTSYEKGMFAVIILFFCTVKFLQNYG